MRLLLLVVCTLLYLPVLAQNTGNAADEEQKRLVYFTDKNDSPFSLAAPQAFLSQKALERRQRQRIPLTSRDLPVNPAYVEGLQKAGIAVWYTSRWFNAAVVQCSDEQLQQVEALPFVRRVLTLNRVAGLVSPPTQSIEQQQLADAPGKASSSFPLLNSFDYGPAFHQADMLGADELHADGYTGAGMTIAVLDAGFPEVDQLPAFSHLFEKEQLKGSYDFVLKQENALVGDPHGTAVLSTMAAYAPGSMIGTAYGANYLLLRTEDTSSEHNVEEINWLLAAEYADSAGADIINSSLGYTTFDAPSQSYTYEDMDGNSSLVTRAADFAAATGMLVVVSAGNDGDKDWRFVSAPADADSVLAVGAVDSLGAKALFSSFGPTVDGRIKPDVVAQGQQTYVILPNGALARGNGTSFSGPVIAGFTAALWQANPYKTNLELIGMLKQSGSNASSPDNNIGYGIPNYSRTLTALPPITTGEASYITNPVQREPVILYLGKAWHQQQIEVQVLDATGKQVYRQLILQAQPEQSLQLDPQVLQQGLYLCRIRSGGKVATLRFVKL